MTSFFNLCMANVIQGMSPKLASEAVGISQEEFKAWQKADTEFERLVRQARNYLLGKMECAVVEAAGRGD